MLTPTLFLDDKIAWAPPIRVRKVAYPPFPNTHLYSWIFKMQPFVSCWFNALTITSTVYNTTKKSLAIMKKVFASGIKSADFRIWIAEKNSWSPPIDCLKSEWPPPHLHSLKTGDLPPIFCHPLLCWNYEQSLTGVQFCGFTITKCQTQKMHNRNDARLFDTKLPYSVCVIILCLTCVGLCCYIRYMYCVVGVTYLYYVCVICSSYYIVGTTFAH